MNLDLYRFRDVHLNLNQHSRNQGEPRSIRDCPLHACISFFNSVPPRSAGVKRVVVGLAALYKLAVVAFLDLAGTVFLIVDGAAYLVLVFADLVVVVVAIPPILH